MIKEFIRKVQDRKSTSEVDNIYKNKSIQLENITKYINFYAEKKPNYLLVGEAPGYKGCGITGIPFVDEMTIKTNKFLIDEIQLSAKGNQEESSSKIIWQKFNKEIVEKKIMFWNIFPFHPHKEGSKESNRTPNSKELLEGKVYFDELLRLLELKKENVYCIGMSSFLTIFNEVPTNYLRHPSFGGKNLFIEMFKTKIK